MIEFKKERYGADVATIHESAEQIVEVVRRDDGLFSLIIHNRVSGDRWEDLTATLSAAEFIKLGEVADAYQCVEAGCPSFGRLASRGCRCHPSYAARA